MERLGLIRWCLPRRQLDWDWTTYVTSASSDDIKVYDLNGSSARTITIATSRANPYDLTLDANATIYISEEKAVTCLNNDGTFRWRTGRSATISYHGSEGTGNGEFKYAKGISIHPSSGELFVADEYNNRIQVLDKNGTFIRKFGSYGTAPGQLKYPKDIVFLSNGTLVVGDDSYLNYFQADGTFIKRTNISSARGMLQSQKMTPSSLIEDCVIRMVTKLLILVVLMIMHVHVSPPKVI